LMADESYELRDLLGRAVTGSQQGDQICVELN
jgi:hypothetical protein